MKLGWPHVLLVGILATGIVLLTMFNKDTAPFAIFAATVLAGAGLAVVGHQAGQIKEATNGNTARLMTLLEAMSKQLALMNPPAQLPPADDPPSDTGG